jgi:hypothetical protein
LSVSEDLTITQVAERLTFSVSWLEKRLRNDARKPASEQHLQFHRYRGARKLWDETEYQALRAAIDTADTERRRGSRSSNGMDIGTSSELSASRADHSAVEEVLNWPLPPATGMPLTRSAGKKNRNSLTKSFTASTRASRLGLHVVNTSNAPENAH